MFLIVFTSLCIRWLAAGWRAQRTGHLVKHDFLEVRLLGTHAVANFVPNVGEGQRAPVQLLPFPGQILSSVQ